MSDNHNTRKPHNYSEELTPTELEEWANMDMETAAAEVRRIKEIGEAVNMFESFQRWLKTADSGPDSELKPKPRPKRFRFKSKSKLRPRPQIHYHRMRVRVKQQAIVKGFRK